MVLVAAIAFVFAGLAELIHDGGLRVLLVLGPGTSPILHVAFALLLLLWWVAVIHILLTLGSAIRDFTLHLAEAFHRGERKP
jgi:hypothetical protein